MPLDNKRYVTKDQLEEVEQEISWINKAISRYQLIAKGGKDGRMEAVSLMKDIRAVHVRERDSIMARPTSGKMLKAVRCASLVEAYTHMIGMLENTSEQVKFYESQLKEKQKYLADLKKFSIR